MRIVNFFKIIRKLKSFQSKNEALLACAVEQGFFMPEIRHGLRVMNRIKMAELTGGAVTIATVSNTVSGVRRNAIVMAELASKLGLNVEQLFPGNGNE